MQHISIQIYSILKNIIYINIKRSLPDLLKSDEETVQDKNIIMESTEGILIQGRAKKDEEAKHLEKQTIRR